MFLSAYTLYGTTRAVPQHLLLVVVLTDRMALPGLYLADTNRLYSFRVLAYNSHIATGTYAGFSGPSNLAQARPVAPPFAPEDVRLLSSTAVIFSGNVVTANANSARLPPHASDQAGVYVGAVLHVLGEHHSLGTYQTARICPEIEHEKTTSSVQDVPEMRTIRAVSPTTTRPFGEPPTRFPVLTRSIVLPYVWYSPGACAPRCPVLIPLPAYAPATRCPVLTLRTRLRICYAMSGTELAYAASAVSWDEPLPSAPLPLT
eukprot:3631895-Rhodomonas_salina.2